MYHLGGSLILGWSLGANDAANVFGTAVASRMVRFRTASVLTAAFVVIGALVDGSGGFHTLSGLTHQTIESAAVVSAVAGLTVVAMTSLKLPISASQAVVGAIIGMGLALSPDQVKWSGLVKVVTCWIGTPIGSAIIAAVLYPLLGALFDRLPMNLVTRSIVLKFALLIAGTYGAYALGANNVANVTGMFYRTGLFRGARNEEFMLALIGGVSIAMGALTFSRHVMITVGSRLVQLGAFSAFVAILAQAITVHLYAHIGVPVSTSQAIVGAVLGIGITKSARTIDASVLVRILAGWIMTPLLAGGLCHMVATLAM